MKRFVATALPAILLLSLATHAAAAVGPSKCSSSKLKATGKKASSRAKCYSKAVSKGDPVDSGCLAKAHDKLTSGFTKAESKGDCLAPNGDVNAIESKVDTFVNNIRNIVNSSGPGPNGCDSKKIQAAGKKASSKLKCQSKAVSKGIDVDPTCLSKAEDKFASSISKAEGAGGCTHTGQTNALESAVNAFVGDAKAEEAPTTTTSSTSTSTSTSHSTSTSTSNTSSTSTSSSTTTSSSTSHSTSTSTSSTTSTSSSTSSSTSTTLRLGFTVVTGTTSCGAAGLATPPAAPTAGSLGSTTGCTGDVSPLGLGCLYFGGGAGTVVPPGAIPDGSTSFLTLSGGGTLTGRATGNRDTCTVGAGPGHHCINNNSVPACATDGNCGGAAGACALDANCFFGPPLPIVSPAPFAALTTCVLNAVQTTASGTATIATGASSISLPLSSRVYISGNTASPCPKCLSGSCDPTWKTNTATTSPDTGAACTAVGTKMTSNDCRPSLPGFQAPLPVSLNPLTTGTTSKTSGTGMFCPQNNAGAFGQGSAQCITETGQDAGSLVDGLPHNAHLVSVFCIPATGNAAVDGVADLPGPGAFSLNGNSQVQ